MAKPNDLPPEVQAAAIISATNIALKPIGKLLESRPWLEAKAKRQ